MEYLRIDNNLDQRRTNLSRRALLGRALVLAGALASIPLVGCSDPKFYRFNGTREQIQLVESLSEGLYRDLAKAIKAPYEEVHTYNYCIDLAPKLRRALHAQNFNAWFLESPRECCLTFHLFVGLDNGWVADPTWQQFVIPARPDLPKVLVAHQNDLPQKLAEAGLRNFRPIWTEAQVSNNRKD